MRNGEQPFTPARGFEALAEAARDRRLVTGWTHNFYRYPARFSPRFAAAAIEHFSSPGDLVADPYMGGGTAVVEGIAAGRHVIGNDLNALAAFITKVKTTSLTPPEASAIRAWWANKVSGFSYHLPSDSLEPFIDHEKTTNLSLARARFIKKVVAAALASIAEIPTQNARDFLKCVVLCVGQWALDGRRRHTPLTEFRQKLAATAETMLEWTILFADRVRKSGGRATILNVDAAAIEQSPIFRDEQKRVALVVTSPPYPGVHVLYHRWQVDGRRETPAPYWIASCNDGQGASFYNFGDRREAAANKYFETSLATLRAIRRIMKDGGYMIQIVAFNRPSKQLARYVENMRTAGFAEASISGDERIWRHVPNRKWHATLGGSSNAAHEVLLIHRAV